MCSSTLTNHSATDYGLIVDKENRLVDELNEVKFVPHLVLLMRGGLYFPDIDRVYKSSVKKVFDSRVASDVDIDADNVGRPLPSLRGAPTSSDQPESRMSQLKMENKITLLTYKNGSTLDPRSHLNQVVSNVGNWDPWSQSKQGGSGMYMLSYAEYYAIIPHFLQGELDIAAHRSRLAFLIYSFGMAKQIYRYESESDNIAKTPTTKVPSTKASSTKAYDRKRKAGDVKK
ncbi:hypothetical protein POM88_002580 [Heracleum sosnowskyi]|uniref:Uncharacterized protein n=1 Tax=Heracleum sosnowskyi TaxID=360622 RepID=A0AAD8N617_9APIA|nr:hypothetical protein POM88_002580 [Heracleum sosnowskyi]